MVEPPPQVAELAFMPWLRLGDPVVVGPVTFFDYPSTEPPVAIDAAGRERLDRLKAAYRTWPDQSEVATIVVAALAPGRVLEVLENEERRLIRRASHALAFACLARGYHHPFLTCSSDNFLLYHQKFDTTPGVAIQTGRKLMHFGESGLTRFVCPPWTPASADPIRPDHDLLDPLAAVVRRDDDPSLRRLWLALESFFFALTDNEMSKGLWRLVHLTIAFEALLNFRSRAEFVNRIGNLCAPYCRASETAVLFEGPAEYARVQLWASDFYRVRNALVHGKPEDNLALFWRDVRAHEEIAVRVFRMCVRERLAEFVPGPDVRAGEPLRFLDLDFDDWILDDRDQRVRQRRART